MTIVRDDGDKRTKKKDDDAAQGNILNYTFMCNNWLQIKKYVIQEGVVDVREEKSRGNNTKWYNMSLSACCNSPQCDATKHIIWCSILWSVWTGSEHSG